MCIASIVSRSIAQLRAFSACALFGDREAEAVSALPEGEVLLNQIFGKHSHRSGSL